MSDVAGGTRATKGKWIALTAMLFAVAMTFIDQTIVAIASPKIQSELSLSRSGTQWMINGYLLALAAAFALGGRLTDVLGHRRMVLIGIVGFAGSSALCGATPKGSAAQTWIIVFRVTQGLSGAIMIPAALAIVVATFPLRERGRALAIFFGVSGGLTAVGPIAGGYLTQWTWRAIFWVNIPVAVIALVLTLIAHVPPARKRESIDVPGAILVMIGMGLSVFGFEQASTWGWSNPGTWVCIVGGLVVLARFIRVEARTRVPLIKVRIFRDRAFLVDNGVLFFSMIAFVPVFFFASVYSQVSLDYTPSNAGLYLLVFFAGFAPAAQIGGRMLDEGGARRPMIFGSALATTGFALWAWKLTDLNLGSQWIFVAMAGAGIGFILGPASTDAVNRSIGASYGEVTGITQTVRNYASALGIAVFGSVLSTVFSNRLTDSFKGIPGLPAGLGKDIAQTVSGASSGGGRGGLDQLPAGSREAVGHAITHDFAVGNQYVFYGMAIALGLSFLVALRHPGGIVEEPTEETIDAAADHAPAAGVMPRREPVTDATG